MVAFMQNQRLRKRDALCKFLSNLQRVTYQSLAGQRPLDQLRALTKRFWKASAEISSLSQVASAPSSCTRSLSV